MATFDIIKLSGSTNGRQVKVVATATPGTTVHTATATSNGLDQIWLYAVNSDTASIKLTIELGGTTAPDDLVEVTVPPESGLMSILVGQVLDGGVVVKAFAASANLVLLSGWVVRKTP
jgi:hypothetical protein